MNKFWQNFFLMNEAGEGGDAGGSPAPADNTPAPTDGADNPGTPAAEPSTSTGLESNLFDDDTPADDGADNNPDDKSEPEPKDDYDPEQAFSDFEFQLPEGYTLTDEQKAQYVEMAKEKGVKPEQLQTFVDKHIEAESAKIESFRNTVRSWEQEVINDPEIGGANFKQTKQNVNNACSLEGGAEFKQTLAEIGLISHPSVVRYLNKLGAAMNNDSFVNGGAAKHNDGSIDYTKMYPNSNY